MKNDHICMLMYTGIKKLWKNIKEAIRNIYWRRDCLLFILYLLYILILTTRCQPQTSYKICLKSFPVCFKSSTLRTVTNTLHSNFHYNSNTFNLVSYFIFANCFFGPQGSFSFLHLLLKTEYILINIKS